MGYIGRYTAPSIVDLESPVSVDGTTIIENGVLKNVGIDGIKLKSSGDSITKSDGTTAVLSESGGTVTLTADEANVGSNALVVDSSGNVGVGTSSNYTNAKLHISAVNAGGDNSLRIQNASTTSGTTTSLKFTNTTSDYAHVSLIADRDRNLIFKNTSDTVETMRIDSSGNVGISTSTPSYKLDITGPGTAGASTLRLNDAASLADSKHLLLARGSATAYVGIAGSQVNDPLIISRSGNYDLRIESSGNVKISNLGSGDVYATSGTLYISSDIRLKNDLGTIGESGIEIIKQLTPRYYSWKEDENDRKQLGFFAQEVFPILPEAVPRDLKYEQNSVDENGQPILEQVLDENGEPDYQWGFATQPIVAMLVKAVQEQQTLIESQQSQIDTLTSKNQEQDLTIASLISRIEALETQP